MATKTKWENDGQLIDLKPVKSDTGDVTFVLDGGKVTATKIGKANGKLAEAQTFSATRLGVVTVDERDNMVLGGLSMERANDIARTYNQTVQEVLGGLSMERATDICRTYNQTVREDATNGVNADYRDAVAGTVRKSDVDKEAQAAGISRDDLLAFIRSKASTPTA
jgi:hypothetical protein